MTIVIFFMTFLKELWVLLKPFHASIIWILILIIFGVILSFVGPTLFKDIIDGLVAKENNNFAWLIWLAVLLFFVYGIELLLDVITDRTINRTLNKMDQYLPLLVHKKLIHLSLRFHEEQNTGSLAAKIQRGTDKLLDLVGQSFFEFIPTFLQAILTFVYLMILNIKIAFVFILVIPFFVFLTIRMNRKQAPLRSKIHTGFEKAAGSMSESIRNIKTVQSFAQEEYELSKHQTILSHLCELQDQKFKSFIRYNSLRQLTVNFGRFFLILLGIFLVTRGDVSAGTLVLFLTLSEKAYFSLFRLTRIYDRIVDSSEAVKRIQLLLKEKTFVPIPKKPKRIKNFTGKIKFENVEFSYREEKNILRNISFTAEAGETIALVGPSGSGKSTIVRLLYRHDDPTKGKVLIDGKDLKTLDLHWYREKLGIVTQEIDIFNATIKANIAYAKSNASEKEILEAARLAHADEFIQYLSDKYDTIVGERGVKLSGGQRQRIGIARALLNKPKILVLDEATSSLDSQSERKIQEALEEIMHSKSMTILVIAHRLSTIKRADKIIVLEDGKIAESGRHYELIKKAGLYSRLHEIQFER